MLFWADRFYGNKLMKKIALNLSLIKIAKLIHLIIVILIIGGIMLMGRELYENFYLPYALIDTPVIPTVSLNEDPDTKLLNDTAEQLKSRQVKPTSTIINDIFWPKSPANSTPTSSRP